MTSAANAQGLTSASAIEGTLDTATFGVVRTLIEEEQARDACFVRSALPPYLDKLATHAEFIADIGYDGCRGFVAFYCNDLTTLTLFVTLILVAPAHRRTGLSENLLDAAFERARARGFNRCRLEVHPDNRRARNFYTRRGFEPVETWPDSILLERML
ncbi:GNAT family N-acetyltransferase [Burkholderia lata]|uniref:Mycothiol acetyltransferase n=1 Tax=Burkholderia lata (strain ATCC 17760 / DSM 23089 / LMG 22485 / NCIMB 9086 / R18194 / 383) TaxID=482957 RepID=A0A6P2RLU2_BURL3|nr:GNAT family N-acetyltransferase [Burkholderia lata]VWC37941.1 Mycothiol acetyltransferase [Burkholderia lata]